jgi:hypothetical protein
MTIKDADFRILAGISQALQGDYRAATREWEGSPFQWITQIRSSRQRGVIGEKLIAGWLAARGFNVARSGDSDADRVIEGKRIEIKFSTRWSNGTYVFQQLRDQDYELAMCLGVSPFDAHCWIVPKPDIMRLWKEEHLIQNQHRGRRGEDTGWFRVSVDDVPAWLRKPKYGGTLSKAVAVLSKITGFKVSAVHEAVDGYRSGKGDRRARKLR